MTKMRSHLRLYGYYLAVSSVSIVAILNNIECTRGVWIMRCISAKDVASFFGVAVVLSLLIFSPLDLRWKMIPTQRVILLGAAFVIGAIVAMFTAPLYIDNAIWPYHIR